MPKYIERKLPVDCKGSAVRLHVIQKNVSLSRLLIPVC